MLRVYIVLVFVALVACQDVLPPIPLLSQDPGVPYFANSTAPLKLEAFFELNCGDSRYAWGILKQVADHYGRDNINLVIQQLVLPYHRNAFLCTQGLYVVEDFAPDKVFDYMDIIFENIGEFSSSANYDKTERETLDRLAELAEQSTGILKDTFKLYINFYGGTAVYNWKYATRRGAAGTPWFYLNNIDLGINPGRRLSFNEWTALLDPLLP